MKFLLAVLLCSIFLIAFALADQPSQSKIDSTILKNSDLSSSENVKVIVWIDRNEYKKAKVSKAFSLSEKQKIRYEYDIIPAVAMDVPANRIESMARHGFVKKIEPVLEVKAFLQDSVPLINASKVWSEQVSGINITGKNTGICILDTGVNYTHPDLGGCFGSGCKVVAGYDYVNSDTDPADDNGHGTHVTGIAAANGGIKGIAPNASIIAIKVLNSTGEGISSDIIAGIEWCTNNKIAYNISVISMSLGTKSPYLYSSYCDNEDPPTTAAINAAIEKNITVVAATGNDGNTTHIALPACIQNATAVGATTKTDGIIYNRNNITDLLAPGQNINSTSLSGSYTVKDGTSMSTPHVAGAFALLYQKYKLINGYEPTPSYLQNILNNTGIKINDTSGNKLNFSRIDVYAASLQLNENVAPQWSNQSGTGTIGLNGTVLLSAYWTDNALLSYALLSTNETGAWQNKSSLALSGSAAWSNFSWQNTSITNDTVIGWRIFANDTSGNQNVTDILTFRIADAPKYFNETNSSDNIYAPGKTYWFNITWTDNTAIHKIIFEWNSTENITFNASADNFYSANRTDLAAGVYSYRWLANDSAGNWNSTQQLTYNVSKAPTSVRLWLNDTENNRTYFRGAVANITAQVNLSILNVNISANFSKVHSDINSSVSLTFNFTNTGLLNIGIYNITAYTQGNQNYSVSQQTYFLIIRNLYSNNSINITANNSVLVNASALNITISIMAKNSTNASMNITVGIDNPTGATLPQGLNKFIAIETENITLAYSLLNVSYADVSIPAGVEESSLRLYRWNGTNWERLAGGADTAQKYVWANLTQFSNFTIGGLLADGEECTTDENCSSGNCAKDYDDSGSWCAPVGNCAHDGSVSYTNGITTCYGSYKETCSSGTWSAEYCTYGCSNGACSGAPQQSSYGVSGYVAPQNKTQNVTQNITQNITQNNETKEDKGFRVCAQVITPALSPEGECKEFPTPCDVPENWTKVESCPVEEEPKKTDSRIFLLIFLLFSLSAYYIYVKKCRRKHKKSKAQKSLNI